MATETPLLPEITPRTIAYTWEGVGHFSLAHYPHGTDPRTEIQILPIGGEQYSILVPPQITPNNILERLETGNINIIDSNEGNNFVSEIYGIINTTILGQLDNKDLPPETVDVLRHSVGRTNASFIDILGTREFLPNDYGSQDKVIAAYLLRLNNLYTAIEAKASGQRISLQQMFSWLEEYGRTNAVTSTRGIDPNDQQSITENTFSIEYTKLTPQQTQDKEKFVSENITNNDIPQFDIDPLDYLYIIELIRNAYKPYVGAKNVKVVVEYEEAISSINIHIGDDGPGFNPDNALSMFENGTTSGDSTGQGLYLLSNRTDAKFKQPRINLELISKGKDGRVFIITSDRSKVNNEDGRADKFVQGELNNSQYCRHPVHVDGEHGSIFTVTLNYFDIAEDERKTRLSIDQKINLSENSSISISKQQGDGNLTITIDAFGESTSIEIPIRHLYGFSENSPIRLVEIIAVIMEYIKDKPYAGDVIHLMNTYTTSMGGYFDMIHKIKSQADVNPDVTSRLLQDFTEKVDYTTQLVAAIVEGIKYLYVNNINIIDADEFLNSDGIQITKLVDLLEKIGSLNTLTQDNVSFNIDTKELLNSQNRFSTPALLHAAEIIRNAQKPEIRARHTNCKIISNGDSLIIGILDDGIGFDPKEIANKFHPGVTDTASTGLGLAYLKGDLKAVSDVIVITWNKNGAYIFDPRKDKKPIPISEQKLIDFTSQNRPEGEKISEHGTLFILTTPILKT